MRSLWGHFGVNLGSVSISVGDFGSVDGYFAMIVESVWVCEGPFSKKTRISPTDFNNFIKLWSELWTNFGSLSRHFWIMDMTFGPLWGYFGVTFGT